RIERRDHQILGKRAFTVHADADGVAAQMTTTRAAVATEAAGDVPFSGNAVADLEPAHLLTHLDDLADIFVADMHRHRDRLRRPVVPILTIAGGPANRGSGAEGPHG